MNWQYFLLCYPIEKWKEMKINLTAASIKWLRLSKAINSTIDRINSFSEQTMIMKYKKWTVIKYSEYYIPIELSFIDTISVLKNQFNLIIDGQTRYLFHELGVHDSTSCMISILLLITWYWISRYSEKKVWNWCKNKAFSLNKYTNFGRSRLQSISLIIFLLSARKNVCNNFIIIKMHIICVVNYVVFALHLAKNEHVDVMRLE